MVITMAKNKVKSILPTKIYTNINKTHKTKASGGGAIPGTQTTAAVHYTIIDLKDLG